MAIYYMGEDTTKSKAISGRSGLVSEYQDLIDQYFAKGGRITYCPSGRRATDDDWERENVKPSESEMDESDRDNRAKTLFDHTIVDTYPVDVDSYFDNSEAIIGGF